MIALEGFLIIQKQITRDWTKSFWTKNAQMANWSPNRRTEWRTDKRLTVA